MRSPQLSPHPLTPELRGVAHDLIHGASRSHVHLDWRNISEWLHADYMRCWLATNNDTPQALVGATINHPLDPDHKRVAWLRFIIPSTTFGRDPALDKLWELLHKQLIKDGVKQIVTLSMAGWVRDLMVAWKFEQTNAVITMIRRDEVDLPETPRDVTIREVSATEDIAVAAHIDAAAFDPPWTYSHDTIAIASRQASTFTILERGGQALGYQLSTRHGGNGHLARLAVLPELQGKGLGGLLVAEMVRFFHERGLDTVTVNTQQNNIRSQRLYQRLGFEREGFQVPVWTRQL